MSAQLYLTTTSGLAIAERNGSDWTLAGRALDGTHVTCVLARDGVSLAGTRRVVAECTDGRQVAPALAGMIRGMAEHKQHQGTDSPSEAAYQVMKEHSPNVGDT